MLLYPRSTARRPRSRPAYRDSASPVPPAAAHRHRHRHRRSECPRASRHRVPRAWNPRGRHGCAARPGSALPSARITARRLTPCPRATALRGRFARPRVPRPAARARLGGTPAHPRHGARRGPPGPVHRPAPSPCAAHHRHGARTRPPGPCRRPRRPTRAVPVRRAHGPYTRRTGPPGRCRSSHRPVLSRTACAGPVPRPPAAYGRAGTALAGSRPGSRGASRSTNTRRCAMLDG